LRREAISCRRSLLWLRRQESCAAESLSTASIRSAWISRACDSPISRLPCAAEGSGIRAALMTRARVPQPAGIEATTVGAYSCGLSIARPVCPCLPPAHPPALPSIAVAGPNAPYSISPCRRTSPPGSNSRATAARALPAQPLSNVSSAGISNAAFLRMALPALDAPSAVTIFSLPKRAFVQGPWCLSPLATPGGWSKPPPTWPTVYSTQTGQEELDLPVPKPTRSEAAAGADRHRQAARFLPGCVHRTSEAR
jgi:hypothetical protein